MEICPAHSALAIYVSAEKSGTVWFKLAHYCLRLERDAFSPTVDRDAAPSRIKCDDDSLGRNSFCEPLQEIGVRAAIEKRGTSDNDLIRAAGRDLCSAGNCVDSPAYADSHFKILAGLRAKVLNQCRVWRLSGGCVQVNDVKPRMLFESFEQAKDVGDGEFASSAVDQLHGLAVLQIDAGD